jgi:hypothetical protein
VALSGHGRRQGCAWPRNVSLLSRTKRRQVAALQMVRAFLYRENNLECGDLSPLFSRRGSQYRLDFTGYLKRRLQAEIPPKP